MKGIVTRGIVAAGMISQTILLGAHWGTVEGVAYGISLIACLAAFVVLDRPAETH
jgi:hypothetical protein